jgi:adenosine deaminase/adenosine deaminase CECR1
VSSIRSYAALVDALSTRNAPSTAHDQFFSTFGRFRGIGNDGAKVAEILSRAHSQHIQYLEIMLSLGKEETASMGQRIGLHQDLATTRQELLAGGLIQAVERARESLDDMDATVAEILGCGKEPPGSACSVGFRYIQSTNRTLEPQQVFAGLLFSFLLGETDSRVVGVNLVGPEDHPLALRDYGLHMDMVGFLHQVYPDVNISLHAGELTLGLVPPEHLRFHIRRAVEQAGARRIGHGTDLAYEMDAVDLLADLTRRQVLIEISLSSSEKILSVRGGEHPFQAYLDAGVPVALVTDDEGVLRTDLTHEFYRAATTYNLGYGSLKALARNSLSFCFLAGPSLWKTNTPPRLADPCAGDWPGAPSVSPSCAEFLARSERARAQWKLEKDFLEFENLSWLDPDYPASDPSPPPGAQ